MSTFEDAHLADVPLFARLSKEQLRKVSRLTTLVSVPAGSTVIEEGTTGRELMIVAEGEAEVRKGGTKVASCGPGDLFGEMAVVSDERRVASVVAVTDLHLEVIERSAFRALAADEPDIAAAVQAVCDERRRSTPPD